MDAGRPWWRRGAGGDGDRAVHLEPTIGMTMSQALGPLLVVLGAGCVSKLGVTGAGCPCPAGYCCEPETNTCVVSSTCPSSNDAGESSDTSDADAPAAPDAMDATDATDTMDATDAADATNGPSEVTIAPEPGTWAMLKHAPPG